jgi:hypothetical protein
LPALPATTPRVGSPSVASFASAPRSLNEPVRWRFSALTTMSPPQRSVMLLRLNTGVCRTSAPAAAWMRRSSSSDASVSVVGAI